MSLRWCPDCGATASHRSDCAGEERWAGAAVQMVARAAEELGIRLPDTWAKRDGSSIQVEFTGVASLWLRTDARDLGTWSLWFGGARMGLFTSPWPALAEALARGWLGKMRAMT